MHFYFYLFVNARDLHSFPTRRSSDLQATTNQNVKKRPACSELRWAYCNHKATYFASYLTGGDCVRSEERFSRNAETDLVCRLLLEKKKNTTNSDVFRNMRQTKLEMSHIY